ncbi:MAG: sodium-dependent transporter [Methanomicrobiales archaeon]|nr:sodium-dependent transporter [Methanomicrobiales archaeon]
MPEESGIERWSSHAGFILAAIGAAVGIGNIWRFPTLLGQNGGGAFLIPYFVAVFVFALPLMVLEISAGRQFRGTVLSAFGAVRPRFRILGWLICIISFIITSYYLVITGWTLAFLSFSVTGSNISFAMFTSTLEPLVFTAVAALVTALVVAAGVRKGIERMATLLIPACIVILIIMVLSSITLPGFAEGMQFLFTPDFSVLTRPDIWLAAFGQALFSLSVGEGIMLTYGAYMAQEQDIRKSAIIIAIADTSVALLAGIVIFPVVFSCGLSPAAGAELAFTTLPVAFATMPFGRFFATAFFALLFFAAITTTVALLEVYVAAVRETMVWTRRRATLLLSMTLFAAAMLPALSYSALNLTIDGLPFLDFLDRTAGTVGLHITAIIVAVVFTTCAGPGGFFFENGGPTRVNRCIFFLCKYLIPAVLIVTVVADLFF